MAQTASEPSRVELLECWPTLHVSDFEKNFDWLIERLGFRLGFRVGHREQDPPFATLLRDAVVVCLRGVEERPRRPPGNSAYIRVSDVDGFHAELCELGAAPLAPPETRAYGHRDFGVRMPEGIELTFWSRV